MDSLTALGTDCDHAICRHALDSCARRLRGRVRRVGSRCCHVRGQRRCGRGSGRTRPVVGFPDRFGSARHVRRRADCSDQVCFETLQLQNTAPAARPTSTGTSASSVPASTTSLLASSPGPFGANNLCCPVRSCRSTSHVPCRRQQRLSTSPYRLDESHLPLGRSRGLSARLTSGRYGEYIRLRRKISPSSGG